MLSTRIFVSKVKLVSKSHVSLQRHGVRFEQPFLMQQWYGRSRGRLRRSNYLQFVSWLYGSASGESVALHDSYVGQPARCQAKPRNVFPGQKVRFLEVIL